MERLKHPSAPNAASIAVLPLANESGEAAQQYFSDGISEDLITALRISRKEGQRFTACRSMVSRHVGPVLMKQDVLNFLSETNIRQ
jgi:TolB-like protein